MGKLKFLGVDEIPEEHTPEKFANSDDTVAATEPILSDESIMQWCVKSRSQSKQNVMKRMTMVRSKPTSIELRSAIETLMDFSFIFSMESEEVQRSKLACLFA